MSTALTLRYAGIKEDCTTGGYLLGNGYRLDLPSLMRFAAPDASSPFDEGGVNPYAYCAADPINHRDPSGHFFLPVGIAIGASAIVALKLGASLIVSRYGKSVKDWIDNIRDHANIAAVHAERDAYNEPDAIRTASAAATTPNRVSIGSRAVTLTAHQVARVREMPVDEQLNVVEERLAAIRKNRENARLLRLGTSGSAYPALLMQWARKERQIGLSRLISTRRLIDNIEAIRNGLGSELTRRLDSADREEETLWLGFKEDCFEIARVTDETPRSSTAL